MPPPGSQASTNQERLPQETLRNLERRAAWRRNHIPTITAVIGLALFATPALILFALALLPRPWLVTTDLVLLCSLAVSVLLVSLGLLFRGFQRWRAHTAEEDVLDLYRITFAYSCEQWEDKWRVIITQPLLRKVRKIQQRLEDMQNFVEYIATRLMDAATQAEQELFTSPAAFRDVFVGDGKVLEERTYTLSDINKRISVLRQNDPQQPWHQTNEQINRKMDGELAQQKLTLLNVGNEQKVIEQMRAFCHALVIDYLRGELVDIGKVMQQDSTIWQKAPRKARILYLPRNEAPESFFICARKDYHTLLTKHVMPESTTLVQTQSRSWMIVARFWAGGAGTRWSQSSSSGIGPSVEDLPDLPDWSA